MKTEPNIMKRRLLLVQRLLYENTDEQHPLTTFEILDYLLEQGILTNRKTLKGDLDLMVECGMDIVTVQSKPNRYFWGTRKFEQAELKLLIDAVSSSRFISRRRSQTLSKKLISLSSGPGQKALKRNIYTTDRVKSGNEVLLYTVDTVNEAITARRKIGFKYTDYTPEKKKVFKHDGEIYTLSPYALFWNQDYYYIVGYSEKHENISTFRADRVAEIEITDEKAVRKPKDFRIDKYSSEVFEMYDAAKTVKVKLKCRNEYMRYVIDRFGEKVETEIADEENFFAYPEVALSPNFYSWVFKFAGEIRIISPDKAVAEISTMAQKLIIAESI